MTPSTINWHSVRTTALIIITLLVNILPLFHALVSPHAAEIIDSVVAILLYIEHYLAGNSVAPSEPNSAATQ